MLKSLVFGLSLLSVIPALAQEEIPPTTQNVPQQNVPQKINPRSMLPLKCGTVDSVVKELKDDGQLLFFYAKNLDYITMMYRNPERTDWYVVLSPVAHPERACIALDGITSETNVPPGLFIPYKPRTEASYSLQ